MTPEEINNQVAEKVMESVVCDNWSLLHVARGEWIRRDKSCGHDVCHPAECVPHFSTNMNAAWQVVEKMRENGYDFEPVWLNGRPFMASFSKFDVVNVEWLTAKCTDKSVPMAICLAALEEMNTKE